MSTTWTRGRESILLRLPSCGEPNKKLLQGLRGDLSELTQAGWRPPEVFTAIGRDGKTEIWGIIIRPMNFDPAKKYPVVENIYAGPQVRSRRRLSARILRCSRWPSWDS